ncbi:TonB-dependent receptor [Paraperlucidibaca wandonensis]|uniref:TonB-dependent receptor n=1 Tax=Paraperlucidibaca wandonensis TaxID=1268273 RepID=A0ABW3HBS7_9GAMM
MFVKSPLAQAVSLVLCVSPALVSAAEAPKTLPTVSVTAAAELATDGYQGVGSRSAMKTNTALKDTPQSISVISRAQLDDQSAQSLADAVKYTPGVSFTQGEGNRDQVVIRGNVSTGDFYVDGLRDDVQYYRDLYNIDRVEVLRGANGLAFGRGGNGGVINRVQKEASWSPVRELTVSGGSYGHMRGALDIGGGLSERVAGRVNVVSEQSDSFRDGVELRRNGISPTLTIQATDATKIVLGAEYFNDLRVADRGIPSQNGKPFKTDESTFFGNAAQSPTETTVKALNASVEHRFANGVLLTNKTRFADYDKYYQNVYAADAVDAQAAGMVKIKGYHNDTQRTNLFNQTDAQFNFVTGSIKHELVTGVELARQDSDDFRIDATFPNNAGQKEIQVSATSPLAFADFSGARSRDRNTVTDTLSIYAQDQIALNEQWDVIVGVRRDRFKTDYTDNLSAANNAVATDTELSPRAALIYKPRKDLSLYASYSQTFQPRAGDQLTSLDPKQTNLDPEESLNKEVGVKWDVRPDLSLTAAAYRLERKNVAEEVGINTGIYRLIDGQLVKGVELGFNGRITQKWQVVGGYAYADSEVDDGGKDTAMTPRHTFSLWNRVDLNDTYGAALGVVSRSEMFASSGNAVVLPGYARVDAALYMQATKDLRLQLNVENLFNTDYTLNAHNDNNISPGSPTNARVTAVYSF